MRNKRGFVFPLYIVLLTLFMCGTVILLYVNQQDNVRSSLVSPVKVLNISDDLKIFEMREKELVEDSLDASDWGEDDFEDDFEEALIDGFSFEMERFLFEDLYWEGEKVRDNSVTKNSLFENLYSVDFDSDEDELVLKRIKLEKRFGLEASGVGTKSEPVTRYPVDVVFEFEREYLITEDDGKIMVEVVE